MPPRRPTEPTAKPRKPPKKKTVPSKTFSTRIANGSAAFLAPSGAVDGRSLAARRFRELTLNLASDLGGADQLSTVQGQLIKRFAGSAVIAELAEAELVKGEKPDIAAYVTLINAQNRLAGTLGIRRVAIDATPSLAQYILEKRREKAARPPEGEEDDGGDDGDG